MEKIKDFKLHIIAFVLVVISEFIGLRSFQVGPGTALLLPMLYALIIGMFLGPKFLKIVNEEEMSLASTYIGITVLMLTAKMGFNIGPNIEVIASSGLPLVLQELGNFGTIFFALPVAVLLGLDREAIGATFSIAREGSLAIIGDVYGLDTPEGQGVMGVYICGTLFGAIYFGLMAGFLPSILPLHPYALAMACGTGSASMMSASSGALAATFPAMETEIIAFAAASNLLTSATGLYASLFVGLPMTNKLYEIVKGRKAKKAEEAA
jgi:hypothetical protein